MKCLFYQRETLTNIILSIICITGLPLTPAGFMQGFGMRSDDMARNAIIQRPFNSYGVVEQDSTKVVLDSINFIGPFPRPKAAKRPDMRKNSGNLKKNN